jgi:hypothetical protein
MSIQVYELSGVNIASENFGGEIVAVNLDSGKYYSILNTGAYVWNALLASSSVDQIIKRLSEHYQIDPLKVSEDIVSFVEQIKNEGLIKPVQESRQATDTDKPLGSYAAPKFEIFSDMQEILLLDPVHDVDASGWPLANK